MSMNALPCIERWTDTITPFKKKIYFYFPIWDQCISFTNMPTEICISPLLTKTYLNAIPACTVKCKIVILHLFCLLFLQNMNIVCLKNKKAFVGS